MPWWPARRCLLWGCPLSAERPCRLAVLGSTGSIGVSTLDVVARHPDRLVVEALTARQDVPRMLEQCRRFRPRQAVMVEPQAAERLQAALAAEGIQEVDVASGAEALAAVARDPSVDAVVAGIVGAAGLLPTLAAAAAGKRVLLANKEALVMAGPLLLDACAASGAELLPVDSEHNAVFQCLPQGARRGRLEATGVRRILLTASGGPFRETPVEALDQVTPDQACAHPNWVMGRKISVDSATMMNKGLEVIEACLLFGVEPEQVEVVIHPQSIVHSMVAYTDGSVLAQLGNPDMRTPIAHTLAFPDRIAAGVEPLDLCAAGRLDFQRPEPARFPCLELAYQALRSGGSAPAVLNAANEVAVEAFLAGELPYTGIPGVIEATLECCPAGAVTDLEQLLARDQQAREMARSRLPASRRGAL